MKRLFNENPLLVRTEREAVLMEQERLIILDAVRAFILSYQGDKDSLVEAIYQQEGSIR